MQYRLVRFFSLLIRYRYPKSLVAKVRLPIGRREGDRGRDCFYCLVFRFIDNSRVGGKTGSTTRSGQQLLEHEKVEEMDRGGRSPIQFEDVDREQKVLRVRGLDERG
jgi:hypothetical protein